jgi:PQQ-dependent dehydrogenase (methanol/ethanol family)
MRLRNVATLVLSSAPVLGALACRKDPEPPRMQHGPPFEATLVAPAGPTDDDGEWRMAAKDYASTRFSKLAEITSDDVARLELAWSFDTGNEKGHEAAPIVADGMMFVVTPYPNELFAFDLDDPGKPKWVYRPNPEPVAQGVACCDVVNRGVAYSEGTVFMNTLDGSTIAVDAKDGSEKWRTKLGDVTKGETMTMAPLVVKDKVLVGNSGGEMGVRGWLTALDTKTGAVSWKAMSTGPDADCLIGSEFHPFYPSDQGADLGVKSWPPGKWETGGGTVWGWVSYDPELDLIYYGTANPGPWNPEQRPGDDKWTAGVFARHPEDGHAVWFYSLSPHDLFDYDGVNENVLLDLNVAGALRHVLVHPDRNGYVYVLDRSSGEVLSAEPFVHVTTTNGIDLTTGRPREVDSKKPVPGHLAVDICPAAPGGKDWQPSAFSPRTGLLYIPHQNLCQDEQAAEANYIAGTPYVGAEVKMRAGPGGHRGVFSAWDVAKAREAWSVQEPFPVWSGALVTAGDVVFYGTMDGWFKALDAKSGTELWKYRTDSGIIGQPVTYRGKDGRQYVAVLAGVGGWAGAIVSAGLDPRDPTAALGFVGAMTDLPNRTRPGGKLYVFALPESSR